MALLTAMTGERRWRRVAPALRAGLALCLLVLNLVLINIISARHAQRADWTRERVFSLAPQTVHVLQHLEQHVDVILFMVPPVDRGEDSLYFEIKELLHQFASQSPWIQPEIIDIDVDPARVALLAQKYSIVERDLRQGVVVFATGTRSKYVSSSAMATYQLTARGRELVSFMGEHILLEGLLAVLSEKTAVICFTQEHGEATITSSRRYGYGEMANEIRRAGYKVQPVRIQDLSGPSSGCTVVVIGGPQRGFAPAELETLHDFLRQGGRLFLLAGPVLDRQATRMLKTGLEELMARWGVVLGQNIVLDPLAVPGEQPLMTWATRDGYLAHPISRGMEARLTVWPLTREVAPATRQRAGVVIQTIVQTSKQGWAETDLTSLHGERPLLLDPQVDHPGPVPVALALQERSTRVVVWGTERGIMNVRLQGDIVRDYNRDLFLASLSWLVGQEQQSALGPKNPLQVRILLDEHQLSWLFLLTVVCPPGCCALMGLWIWRRRRGRRRKTR